MGKRDADFESGKDDRERIVSSLNYYANKGNFGFAFYRLNKRPTRMNIAQKNKNNVTGNRIKEAPYKRAMGLYYCLRWKGDRQGAINFIFIIKENGTMYLKLPNEYKENPDGYIELLKLLDFYVLVAEKETNRVSYPISMHTVITWPHKKSETKGNLNRLQFFINIDTIECRHPESHAGLITNKSVMDTLEDLLLGI